MTKSAQPSSVETTYAAEDYAKLYIQEIVGLHGVPVSIISDRDGQAKYTIPTLEDMLRVCVIDFKGNWVEHLPLIEFPYNNSYHSSIQMAPCEDLYGRRCTYPIGWFEVGEAGLIGPDLVHQAMEKVSPMKGVMIFGKKWKLSSQYIGLYRISKRIVNVAYELEVPPKIAAVHSVFHISMLKNFMGDPSLIILTENISIKDNLSYQEIPVQIMDD
ncbi:hypothetical protein MTR67_023449 [Solanum verrucosum]|uniref:Tf2-1-like SH3-like domain-containing protein n=1 Tax=Solanum verrucosum TaxID=315347 RepID=A0AAF0R1W1_SOLVR|nr:hypothetical protein MTR67_023449 [Solanum verrucosum]